MFPCTSSCSSVSGLLFLLTDLGSRLLLRLVSVSESCSVSSWYWKNGTKHVVFSVVGAPECVIVPWSDWDVRSHTPLSKVLKSGECCSVFTLLNSSTLSRCVSWQMQRLRNFCHSFRTKSFWAWECIRTVLKPSSWNELNGIQRSLKD